MRTVSIVTLVALAMVAAAAMPAQADLVPIDYCSTGTTVLQDLQVNANPFPPQKGVPLVINATAMLTEALTSPLAVSVTVSLNGWPLISKSVPDACAVKAGLCPYPAGNFTFGHAIKVPSWIPSGTIGLQVQATNGDGNTIVCASLSITLSSPKPAPDADRVAIAIAEIDEPLEAMTHALESMPHSVLSEEERQRALKDFSYALIFGASEPE